MKLSRLLPPGARLIHGDADVTRMVIDSRAVSPGDLFICIKGLNVDRHDLAADAVAKGATALLCERELPLPVPQIIVGDAREGMTRAAAAFYGHPEEQLRIIGVTGTHGKTSTTFIIKAIAEACGYKVGLIGTVHTMIGNETFPSGMTTPDPVELFGILRRMADAGVQLVVMEVSAHALYLRKLEGITFKAALFTNLSQDHLDIFHTMEHYEAAKRLLFRPEMCEMAVINADDGAGARMAEGATRSVTFGIREPADIYANDIEFDQNGTVYMLRWADGVMRVRIKLPGMFNVYNSLAAAACCLSLGMNADLVRTGMEGMRSAAGRIERVEIDAPYQVYIDFAHAPEGLRSMLMSMREWARGRLIVVFGCGGDRDREKRSIMGAVAARLADFSVITSDNPRSEEPMDIIRMIEEGHAPISEHYEIVENRREAIKRAMSMAQPDDIVVLAGKGHETYQEIKGQKRPFDETAIVKELLEELRAQ